jgi:4-aminobutyrate aminotransferase-like enzyme
MTAARESMINAFDPAAADQLPREERQMVQRRAHLLGGSYKLFYKQPIHVVRGEGVWLYGPGEERYLDAYNNVPNVGHCHPRVTDAVSRQMATLNTHTRYLNEAILRYSADLLATFPTHLDKIMYTTTGSEAGDLALRIARYETGGEGVIALANAYHGLTAATVEISPSMGPNVPVGRSVWLVTPPDQYREGPEVEKAFAGRIRAAIADMQRHGVKLAAMVIDSIMSSDGVFSEPVGILGSAVKVVHEHGGLFIADEVQPGFGRVGTHFWGFERHGADPDIVVMGKPMANGVPIAGIVLRSATLERFGSSVRYFNTFGGNTVSIAAAQATLDVLREENLQENARLVGQHLMSGLRDIGMRFERLGDVRGSGLFIGVDFVRDAQTKVPDGDLALQVVNGLRDRNILISASGKAGNVLKIRPPLPFSNDNADQLIEALNDVLKAVS